MSSYKVTIPTVGLFVSVIKTLTTGDIKTRLQKDTLQSGAPTSRARIIKKLYH